MFWENWQIINFVYLLIGMGKGVECHIHSKHRCCLYSSFFFLGIIAMCYNLMKEEVLLRLQEIKADLLDRLQDMGLGRGGHR